MNSLLMGQPAAGPFVRAFCWMLVHSLWQGMVIALLAGLVVLLTRRVAPAVRYNLLSALFVLFLLGAALSFTWEWQRASLAERQTSMSGKQGFVYEEPGSGKQGSFEPGSGAGLQGISGSYEEAKAGQQETMTGKWKMATTPKETREEGPAVKAGQQNEGEGLWGMGIERILARGGLREGSWLSVFCNRYASIIVMVWFVLFSIRCLQICFHIGYTRRLRRSGVHEPESYWKMRVLQLADRLNIKKQVRLLESELAKVPMMAGFLKPVILVPLGMLSQLPPDQVEAVLLHELAHIKRKDWLVNILQHFAEIIFFFNPGVLWLSSLLRDERENCCDDMAIGETKNKQQFIHALLSFQENQLASPRYGIAFPGTRKDHLLQRVRRIVYRDNKTLDIREKYFLLACLFVTGAITLAFSNSGFSPVAASVAGKDKNGMAYSLADTVPGLRAYPDRHNGSDNDHFRGLLTMSPSGITQQEGIKREGDTTTFYSRGYEIVAFRGAVSALYYRGEKVPKEEIPGHTGVIQKIIQEKLQEEEQWRKAEISPVSAKTEMSEARDRMESAIDEKRSVMDKAQAERDLQSLNPEADQGGWVRSSADEPGAPVPSVSVPSVSAPAVSASVPLVSAPVPGVSYGFMAPHAVPAVPRASAFPPVENTAVAVPRPYIVQPVQPDDTKNRITEGDFFRASGDTLSPQEEKRLVELKMQQKNLAEQQQQLIKQQERLAMEQQRLQEEWMRMSSTGTSREQMLELVKHSDSLSQEHNKIFLQRQNGNLQRNAQELLLKKQELQLSQLRAPTEIQDKYATPILLELTIRGIIDNVQKVSFFLDKDQLLVNDVKQSEDLHKILKEKYIIHSKDRVSYRRNGASISEEVIND